MGKIDLGIDGYKLTQTGEEVQRILDAVMALSQYDTKELIELLKDIKEYDNSDDDQDIGHQLINALNNMVSEKEVQSSVNDNAKYPPTSKAVKDAIAIETDNRERNDDALEEQINEESKQRLDQNLAMSDTIQDNERHRVALDTTLCKAVFDSADDTKPTEIKLSEHKDKMVQTWYEREIIPDYKLYILNNDTGDEVDWLNVNDAVGYQLTQKIPAGQKRLVIKLSDYETGVDDNRNGKLLVLSSDTTKWELIKELKDLFEKQGGVWHYGTELTHTKETVQNDKIKAHKGDFYLNTEHFYVYYTQNGTGDWIYIGNLSGGVDASKWAPLNSPQFTGTPRTVAPSDTDSSTMIATTAFVHSAIEKHDNKIDTSKLAPLESPKFTGTPTAPTPTTSTSSQQIATTSFVHDAIEKYVSINSSYGSSGSSGSGVLNRGQFNVGIVPTSDELLHISVRNPGDIYLVPNYEIMEGVTVIDASYESLNSSYAPSNNYDTVYVSRRLGTIPFYYAYGADVIHSYIRVDDDRCYKLTGDTPLLAGHFYKFTIKKRPNADSDNEDGQIEVKEITRSTYDVFPCAVYAVVEGRMCQLGETAPLEQFVNELVPAQSAPDPDSEEEGS